MAAGLSSAGYQVVTAHDGARALAQAEETPPDLAIVDLEMPGTNGLDVIRKLKGLFGPAVHIVVMTGHDDEGSHAEAFEAGTDDFVVKPTGMSELKRRLAAATRNHRAFVEVRVAKEAADRRMAYGAEASALLAHDLNNGLAVSLANLQYLKEVLTLGEDEADALDTTVRSLRRMSSLVANFVDIARFEDAAVKPMVARPSHHVLETAIDIARRRSRAECRWSRVPGDLEGRFDAAVERVLHNLSATRALLPRAADRGRGRRGTTRYVEIAVTSSGPLIPRPSARPVRRAQSAASAGWAVLRRLVAEARWEDRLQASSVGPSPGSDSGRA
jgi:DNA-binding response OmpR family regulator